MYVVSSTIFDVSIDGVTQMRQLSSDLMLATSVQNYLYNTVIGLDHVISTRVRHDSLAVNFS